MLLADAGRYCCLHDFCSSCKCVLSLLQVFFFSQQNNAIFYERFFVSDYAHPGKFSIMIVNININTAVYLSDRNP